MRQLFLALLVALTVAMSAVVVASGVLVQPLPTLDVVADVAVPRGQASSRGEVRHPLGEKTPEEPSANEQRPASEQRLANEQRLGKENRARGLEDGPAGPSSGTRGAFGQDLVPDPQSEPLASTPPAVPGGITGVDVPKDLGGNFLVRPGSKKAPAGKASYTTTIEVEDGLPISTGEFSEFVLETLNHKKSWANDGAITFGRTDDRGDFRIILASPATVDRECAPLKTNGQWSCGTDGKVLINAERWVNGAPAFTEAGGDMLTYRRYLINHEVGHLLGEQHVDCPAPGTPAPVMVQQSISLQGCEPNGWVYP